MTAARVRGARHAGDVQVSAADLFDLQALGGNYAAQDHARHQSGTIEAGVSRALNRR